MERFSSRDELASLTRSASPDRLAADELFWRRIASEYEREPGFIQLNYGYYHPSLRPVLDVEIETSRELNRRGSHFKIVESSELLEATRADLARLAGADPEEIVVTRNSSEAINIVIQGMRLEAGDEVVCSDQDYAAVEQVLEQREQSDGILVRRAALPLDPTDDEEILRSFESRITSRTRLVFITHMIHVTGQILPAAKLCALAHRHSVAAFVDAAHSFAQVPFSISELGCDYFCASLHKWLGAPLGTGLLFVRKERIAGLRPLFGDTLYPKDNIRRLERFGNRPDSSFAGIREAVRWHDAIGTPLKQARLAFLHRSWAEPIRKIRGFRVLTPRGEGRYGAIGLVALDGTTPETLCDYLMKDHRIFTSVQHIPPVGGVRIVPGMPTSLGDISKLVEALNAAAGNR